MESGSFGHGHNTEPPMFDEPPEGQRTIPAVGSLPKQPVTQPITELVKQPNIRPITEQQLISEVKGIYAGLVMVEKKCVDIVAQQSISTKRLNEQQWKALVVLHRTLLQEHHDFFVASQHLTGYAFNIMKKLAIKYTMPARIYKMQSQQTAALFDGLLDFGQEHLHLWHLHSNQLEKAEACKVSQQGSVINKPVTNTSISLSTRLTNCTKTYIFKVSSNLIRLTDILEANCIRFCALIWFIASVHANEYGHHSTNAAVKGQSPPSEHGGLIKFLLWLLCGGLIYIVPTTGFDIMSKFKDTFKKPISIASITAFISALAMSASASHMFPDPWGATCTGISIGSSLLLWRVSKAKTNSTLTMFLRYIIPAVLIWSSLLALTLSEQNGSLEISKSIPCLSIFGSAGVNAFVNEKYKEFANFFTWLWDQWSRYPGAGPEVVSLQQPRPPGDENV